MTLAMLFWGLSWASGKILVEYASAYVIAFWRFFFVLLGLLPLLLALRLPLKLDKKLLKWVILASICNVIYSVLYFAGLNYGAAGKGGVLVTTLTPVFTYLLVLFIVFWQSKKALNSTKNETLQSKTLQNKTLQNADALKMPENDTSQNNESQRTLINNALQNATATKALTNEPSQPKKPTKIPKNEIIGLCLGIISGILLLNLGSIDELFGKFNVFFVLCAFDWALMSIFTQKIRTHPLVMNFYITLFSLVAFVPILFDTQTYFLFNADTRFWLNLFVVAILSTIVGTSIYYLGIKRLGTTRANTFLLLVPASALLCSFVILGEKPSPLTLIGTALAVCAIYLINIYGKKAR